MNTTEEAEDEEEEEEGEEEGESFEEDESAWGFLKKSQRKVGTVDETRKGLPCGPKEKEKDRTLKGRTKTVLLAPVLSRSRQNSDGSSERAIFSGRYWSAYSTTGHSSTFL
ncbi:hypothetical protein M0804_002889 [Polistes exclamans]|nr:hypothetical protein M0804_002889 [Polistes exclamans]